MRGPGIRRYFLARASPRDMVHTRSEVASPRALENTGFAIRTPKDHGTETLPLHEITRKG